MFVQNGSAIFVAVLADQAFGELWVTTLSFPFTIAYVSRLTEELEAEIVRQAEAADRRVVLTKQLAQLADERSKLLHAFYANAIPLDLLKAEQDRITAVEHMARSVLETKEGDVEGWQSVLQTTIQLAGNRHAAYLKARPSVRRRFNDAVLEAVHWEDRKITRAEFSEVFAPLFSRPSSNKALKSGPRRTMCEPPFAPTGPPESNGRIGFTSMAFAGIQLSGASSGQASGYSGGHVPSPGANGGASKRLSWSESHAGQEHL